VAIEKDRLDLRDSADGRNCEIHQSVVGLGIYRDQAWHGSLSPSALQIPRPLPESTRNGKLFSSSIPTFLSVGDAERISSEPFHLGLVSSFSPFDRASLRRSSARFFVGLTIAPAVLAFVIPSSRQIHHTAPAGLHSIHETNPSAH
jgi:hypothetical protein